MLNYRRMNRRRPSRIDNAIEEGLNRVGSFFGADRFSWIWFEENENTCRVTHEWAVNGVERLPISKRSPVPFKCFPHLCPAASKTFRIHPSDGQFLRSQVFQKTRNKNRYNPRGYDEKLENYTWPGNVRELEPMIEKKRGEQ